ncbi:hypothetical protein H0H81_004819 [Sphagnurus paluster]|uniref:Uncharacterized protein n=1 Tax=Sphagnurus paluster TaxID=117069 RepID=A0A9P7FR27_9AGAR|nr:hypothetical protein H0H81_004819 [Sphagnurus paluster]
MNVTNQHGQEQDRRKPTPAQPRRKPPQLVSPIASKSPISTPTSPFNIIPTALIRPHHIPLHNHIGVLSAWCTTSGWPVLVMCALKAYAARSVHPTDSIQPVEFSISASEQSVRLVAYVLPEPKLRGIDPDLHDVVIDPGDELPQRLVRYHALSTVSPMVICMAVLRPERPDSCACLSRRVSTAHLGEARVRFARGVDDVLNEIELRNERLIWAEAKGMQPLLKSSSQEKLRKWPCADSECRQLVGYGSCSVM